MARVFRELSEYFPKILFEAKDAEFAHFGDVPVQTMPIGVQLLYIMPYPEEISNAILHANIHTKPKLCIASWGAEYAWLGNKLKSRYAICVYMYIYIYACLCVCATVHVCASP